jgi:hypothetical protein
MSIKTLMSAAHAAGYAMAAEDVAECRPVLVKPEVKGTALALRPRQHRWIEAARNVHLPRLLWLREWFAGYWQGRAAA